MKLNIVNNIKSCYYNYMVVFYLCINYVLPFYDDVIISMQSHSMKLLIGDNDLEMKHIKQKRMIDFIKCLDDNDKLFLEKENNLLVLEYCDTACEAHCDTNCDDNVPVDYTSQDSQDSQDSQASQESQESQESQGSQGSQESQESQGSRKRQRSDSYVDIDESIKCELEKNFDAVSFDAVNLNSDVKNKDD
jgi:hypothetical protein